MSPRVLVLLGVLSTLGVVGVAGQWTEAQADSKPPLKVPNPDKVIARCVGDIEPPSKEAGAYMLIPDSNTHAAVIWFTSWQSKKGEVIDPDHVEIVPPTGRALPRLSENKPDAGYQVKACFSLDEVDHPKKLPKPLPNLQKKFTVRCDDNPQLRSKLNLKGAPEIQFNYKTGEFRFFGADLKLVRTEGRTYLALGEFAVNLDKDAADSKLDYEVTAGSGEKLWGVCKAPKDD